MSTMSIDPDKPGQYPIVLSDALLGKKPKDIFTSIKYNHKADPTPSSQNLHLIISDDTPSTYDLSLSSNNDTYSYNGARTSGDGQYVLIFDPAKKHFVLHRIDSTFDMNLVGAPWNDDENELREQYPQIESTGTNVRLSRSSEEQEAPQPRQRPLSKSLKSATAATVTATTAPAKPEPKKKKPAATPAAAPTSAPKKTKISVREPTPEEEDDDSDDGLTVEYPDGGPSTSQGSAFRYTSTPTFRREPSEEISDEDSDAEFEEDEADVPMRDVQLGTNRDVDHLKLPSPVQNLPAMSDEEIELDLEAELEQALAAGAHESSESEEE